MTFLKKADGARIKVAVRDRPFDRTITCVKGADNTVWPVFSHASLNHMLICQAGFVFDKGEIKAIVKDSSAARNGLLINHQLVEVNGQNVVGMPDLDIQKIIQEAARSITLTILPCFIFDYLTKKSVLVPCETPSLIAVQHWLVGDEEEHGPFHPRRVTNCNPDFPLVCLS